MKTKSIKINIVLMMLSLLLAIPGFGQKDTRYDAGMNQPFNATAGDVNPQTGNLSLSTSDVGLPGRAGLGFSFGRIWSLNQSNVYNMYWDNEGRVNRLDSNTMEGRNRLGVGWSTTLPYIQLDTSGVEPVLNLFFGGSVYQLDRSGVKLSDPEASNILYYDLKDLKVREDAGMTYAGYDTYAGTVGDPNPLQTIKGIYTSIADEAGDGSMYVLTQKDNSKYWFRPDGKPMMNEDKTGLSEIWYFYDENGRLVLVSDTIGRKIRFVYDGAGNLWKIEWDVRVGKKNTDESRQWIDETRNVEYRYASAAGMTYRSSDGSMKPVSGLSGLVTGYREPYVLTGFVDAMGNETKYEYEAGGIIFTFDSKRQHSENVYMMVKETTDIWTADGNYKAKRGFEYEVPAKGMWTKRLYEGYMESYRASREYNVNRLGETMNDTKYAYEEEGESGNWNRYVGKVIQGKVKSTYEYHSSGSAEKDHLLDRMTTETEDGFSEEHEYAYTAERRKELEVVRRSGSKKYDERSSYDAEGNLLSFTDRSGLKTDIKYDSIFSIPIEEKKTVTVNGAPETYVTERKINALGQVTEEIVWLTGTSGKRPVSVAKLRYDSYGNPVETENALGSVVHTEYDETYHAYPIKVWQEVGIAGWANGQDVHANWKTEPDGTRQVRIRSWKVYNSNGSVWIECDNEGYATEHYYDRNGIEIETVNPDSNDERGFAVPIDAGNPTGDFNDFSLSGYFGNFLWTRQNNPGARMYVNYQDDFVHTVVDVDKDAGIKKVNSVSKDGLGYLLEETEYKVLGPFTEANLNDPNLLVYGVKRMEYDAYGRMIALTDADASVNFSYYNVGTKRVKRYDKTWLVSYDDLGRKKNVLYPKVGTKTDVKRIEYNDAENSTTTTDPEGRRAYERCDWSGNVVEVIAYGNYTTQAVEKQVYGYAYDEFGRKVSFKDPKGIVIGYRYDERGLLVEQKFGEGTGSDLLTYNDLGQLVRKKDRKGNVIDFTYDEMGRNTKEIHHPAENPTTVSREVKTVYDNRGNAVRVSSESLIEHYIYDNKNRVITLDRYVKDNTVRNDASPLIGHRYSNSTSDWIGADWLTDATASWQTNVFTDMMLEAGGGSARITGNNATTIWFTDSTISVTGAAYPYEITNNNDTFSFSYDYNDAGMVTEMTYPDGSVHEYGYDNQLSRLSEIGEGTNAQGVTSFVSGFEYSKSGVVTQMNYSNNTNQTWEFDNRKMLSHIRVTGPAGAVIDDLRYKINGSGDILSINENEYSYDGFDRIVGAKTLNPGQSDKVKVVKKYFGTYSDGDPIGGVSYDAMADLNTDGRVNGEDHRLALLSNLMGTYDVESFEYDVNGNRTKLTQNEDEYAYVYGIQNRLERVALKKKGSVDWKTFAEYEYDANGNTTKRTIYGEETKVIEFIYDTMNRVARTTEGTKITEYFYDNAGNRFIKKDADGATLYLRHGQIAVAMDVEMNAVQTTEKGKINRYVLSGDLLAGRVTKTIRTNHSIAVEKSYYHLDHVNSTRVVTDSNGQIVVKYTYRAFGEQLKRLDASGAETTDKAKYSYGGKELDDDTNLYYFNARYYDATIGRFINVDPAQDGTNWYIYCNNNPLSLIDPTGLGWLDFVQGVLDVAGFIPGPIGVIADLANAGVSLARGDYAGAALNAMSAIPGAGDALKSVKMVKNAVKVVKEAEKSITAVKQVSNAIAAVDKAKDASKTVKNISEDIIKGTPHGNPIHKAETVNNTIKNIDPNKTLEGVYYNKSLNTAGLKGKQRPDSIIKYDDGTSTIIEVASPSQMKGKTAKELEAKVKTMAKANPDADVKPIIKPNY